LIDWNAINPEKNNRPRSDKSKKPAKTATGKDKAAAAQAARNP